jgi:ABC-type transport system involved in multi-copper enzyme maturation permease subunit
MKNPLQHKQTGQAVVESIFAFIIFVILLVMICTFCAYLFLQFNLVTAAREGARSAATDLNYKSNNNAAAEERVIEKVQNYFSTTTGQTIEADDIQVTPPTGDIGNRNVTVSVNFSVQNPLPMGPILQVIGSPTSEGMYNLTMSAVATMRYEE